MIKSITLSAIDRGQLTRCRSSRPFGFGFAESKKSRESAWRPSPIATIRLLPATRAAPRGRPSDTDRCLDSVDGRIRDRTGRCYRTSAPMRQHAGLSLVWFSPHLRERTRSYRQRAVARRAGEKRRANESRSGGTGLTFSRPLAFVLLLAFAPAVAACGSGARQDKNEPSGTWKVDVPSASFPGKQRLAQQSQLRIRVENLDSRAIPDLAVTVDGFGMRE